MGQIKFSDEQLNILSLEIGDKVYGKIIRREDSLFSTLSANYNYHLTKTDCHKIYIGMDYNKIINDKAAQNICYKHSQKPINSIGKSVICQRAYYTQLYQKKIVSLKKECQSSNEPLIDNMILNQYLYLKRLNNPSFINISLDFIKTYKDAQFYADERHRIQIMTSLMDSYNYLDSKNKLLKIESINHDYLINVNYILTPSLIKLIETVPNIDFKMRRSQLIAAAIALNEQRIKKFNKNVSYDDILSMSTDKFKSIRLATQKKMGIKLDFRKTKDIRKFVYNYCP